MRLRKPCEHNLYDAHEMSPVDRSLFKGWTDGWCPGGEFLAEDALVIEKVDGEWPEALVKELARLGFDGERLPPADLVLADVATAALAFQVVESE